MKLAAPEPDNTHVPCLAEGSSSTQSAVQKAETMEMNNTKDRSAYLEYFKYISGMTTFEDPYFIKTIRKELMHDQLRSCKAFDSLSPELV
jgi:hypothetical protein